MIIFKIINKDSVHNTSKVSVGNKIVEEIQIDSLRTIYLYKRDPFLGERTKLMSDKDKPAPIKNTYTRSYINKKDPELVERPPELEYKGLIQNKLNGKNIAIVKILNKEYIVVEGAKIEDLYFTRITTDSAIVLYKTYKFTIKK